MPLARVGEIELSYERAGSGPPLLLIMGMSGTFDHWDAGFLEDLRRDFETIVYDHRGVGFEHPPGGTDHDPRARRGRGGPARGA